MMSANMTAASTSCRRTGWSVTSAHSSGSFATSKNEWRSRIARYSGQRAARLAHEPHRRPLDALAARGADEEGRRSRPERSPPYVRALHSGRVDPLAPLWRDWTLAPQRAGARTTARLVLENGGSATWRSHGEDGLQLSYHWLDTTRERDRVGRAANAVPATGRAGRDGRARRARRRAAPPGSLRPPLRPRRGASLLALRGRGRDARRRARRRAADRRAPARRRRARGPRPADGGRARGPGGAARRRAAGGDRAPRRRARRRRRTGRDGCSTRMRRAGRPSAPRSSRPAGRSSATQGSADAAALGARADATRVSTRRFSFRRSSTAPGARRAPTGCRPTRAKASSRDVRSSRFRRDPVVDRVERRALRAASATSAATQR